ncbi:sensor histidine kinase [Pseudoalteromonas umbrosa]|uniref:sensor histidine kinase n=1 Tax=Pseudoalteromonas umbrosa TaxID=3048489 RepID=UPI0024C28723|nr:sensor histidine kinase [Pseudoalteromonas sp. B95]MDK1287427.1 sensor histidine kinase [Pseudoalteromonas sp. B95]
MYQQYLPLVEELDIAGEKTISQYNLKFAPSILARLGEELLPNFDQGIIELVRNSYDADARTCTVTLNDITEPGGSITISDTGHGMDDKKIGSAWLVLGHSSKRESGTTPNGRIQVGDKGLGRLAALRMGHYVVLKSRPEIPSIEVNTKKANFEHRVDIDWCEFDQCSTVDEVEVDVISKKLDRDESAGTTIHIQNLKQKITKLEVERLARSLMLLSNPFEEANDFKLKFVCPDYPELEALVQKGYLNEAEYILKASLLSDGTATAEILDWKGTVRWETTSKEWFREKKNNPIYNAPQADFELNIFHLDSSTFATRNINKKQVSAWLKAVGGVHIYHNEFRVHPYGDEGSDWLDMNLERVNNPSIRPSTNTSIGRVRVHDADKQLKQKTDRVGFREDDTFKELRRFVKDSLNWYTAERAAYAAKLKKAQKDENEKQIKDKERAIKEALKKITDKAVKQEVDKAIRESKAANNRQTKHLKQDLKLYRSLATSGTITAVFSHEISKPVAEIPESLTSAENLVKRNTDSSIFKRYKERTENILGYLSRLSHFAELQLDLLKRNKRRNETIEVIPVIENLKKNFKPLLDREHIHIDFQYSTVKQPKLHGSVCILEAIITNCITNSMRAFRKENFDVDSRVIEIVLTEEAESSLLIRFSDNGPGIVDISTEDIWLPGETTIDNGTGFGLTIVRDSVADLGGSCRVEAKGHMGGATFYFEFVTV